MSFPTPHRRQEALGQAAVTHRSRWWLIRLPSVLILCLLLQACKVELYGDLSERQANDMAALLLEHGFDGQKRRGNAERRYALYIEEEQFSKAVELLQHHGLPRPDYEGFEGFVGDNNLIASPTVEYARFIYALSQEIAQTLSLIDGVVAARVHLVLPEKGPLGQRLSPSSASVLINHHPALNLDAIKPDIKWIVEGAVQGLTYDQITVVMRPTRAPNPFTVTTTALGAMRDAQAGPDRLSWLTIMGIAIVAWGAVLGYIFAFAMWRRQRQMRLDIAQLRQRHASALEAVEAEKALGDRKDATG
ncbi:MAG: type III secretion system inner membrane ring lipoprotein SctJ [Candidatus Competibacterales bacterium]